jgi:hypothetical protein
VTKELKKIETFGDVRRLILDTVVELRNGTMDVNRGLAIAANIKVLNENINAEINAAKVSIMTEGRAHHFGQVVGLGKRLISSDEQT